MWRGRWWDGLILRPNVLVIVIKHEVEAGNVFKEHQTSHTENQFNFRIGAAETLSQLVRDES